MAPRNDNEEQDRKAWTGAFREFMGDTRDASRRILREYVLSPVAALRKLLICAALAAAVAFLPDWPDLEPAARRSLFILACLHRSQTAEDLFPV